MDIESGDDEAEELSEFVTCNFVVIYIYTGWAKKPIFVDEL